MTPAQSRMARAALQLGIRDVAKLAKVAASTISRFEAGETLQPRTVESIQAALEKAGVEFTNGKRPGVSCELKALGANPVPITQSRPWLPRLSRAN